MIDVTDLYQPKHQTIYEAIIDLFSNSQNVDVVIVANQLMKDGNLDKVGGADYLHTLVAFVPTAANATYYAEIVHQRAILRNVIAAGTKIAQLGYSAEGSQAEDVVNLAQAEVYEMSTGRVKQDYEAIGPVVHDALEQLDKLQNGDLKTGVPTGFRDIDDVTQGLQPGQMVVVAGRPAMGKSTLGIDFARSNMLEVQDGLLTGRMVDQAWGDICDGAEKRRTLLEVASLMGISPQQAIAVGDGANDLPMMGACNDAGGLSVAYHAKPAVRAQAKVAINQGGLDRLLEVLR